MGPGQPLCPEELERAPVLPERPPLARGPARPELPSAGAVLGPGMDLCPALGRDGRSASSAGTGPPALPPGSAALCRLLVWPQMPVPRQTLCVSPRNLRKPHTCPEAVARVCCSSRGPTRERRPLSQALPGAGSAHRLRLLWVLASAPALTRPVCAARGAIPQLPVPCTAALPGCKEGEVLALLLKGALVWQKSCRPLLALPGCC